MKTLKNVRFECIVGGSSKFYEYKLIRRRSGTVVLRARYGKLGSEGKPVRLYRGKDQEEAENRLDKAVATRNRHGYVEVDVKTGISVATLQNAREELSRSIGSPRITQDYNDGDHIWPMAAPGVGRGEKGLRRSKELMANPRYIAEEKFDGMRATIHFRKSGLRIFSRGASKKDPTRPIEKTATMPHLAVLKFPKLVGTVLDTEIRDLTISRQKSVGAINSKSHFAKVTVFAFDMLVLRGKSMMGKKQEDRLEILRKIEKVLTKSRYFKIAKLAYTPEEKGKLLVDVLARGGEGIMFKNLDSLYAQGARPTGTWYKLKRSATYDCVITGFTPGKGKYSELIGAVKFSQYIDGELTYVGKASGMTDELRTKFARNQKRYIGKVVEIKGQERLDSGAILHPQFLGLRTDKKAKDCVAYEGEQ